jgi:hypothetical protein
LKESKMKPLLCFQASSPDVGQLISYSWGIVFRFVDALRTFGTTMDREEITSSSNGYSR